MEIQNLYELLTSIWFKIYRVLTGILIYYIITILTQFKLYNVLITYKNMYTIIQPNRTIRWYFPWL